MLSQTAEDVFDNKACMCRISGMTNTFLPKITGEAPKAPPFELSLRKNYVEQRVWAEGEKTNCFRIYGKELTEYPLAIDYYAGRFCVQYFARGRGDENPLWS
jgi:23S rRNA (cytosine1962-C5)-methyltransferase